eukprot:TRINITY_DN648_c0_g2_i1.p1 TRINITY_DN648_c0_g2~~TRINITY_DN648_c0_g2_i1.p1  ORF type:complete len:125 (-),score=12.94 TRINITY_DN648_c0_g2_i1:38-412(-)
MKGVTTLDMSKSSREATLVYRKFIPLWSQYLAHNPDVAALVDPYFVFADVSGGALPANFLNATATYPLVGGNVAVAAPVVLNGANYAWQFATHVEAAHFIDWTQGANLGLHLWMLTTNVPVEYY